MPPNAPPKPPHRVEISSVSVGNGDSPPSSAVLHCTPFERYLIADTSRRAPMTFPIEFCFAQRLDRDRLQDAAQLALSLHPMLTARLTNRGWRLGCYPRAELSVCDSAEIDRCAGVAIDPALEPPIRLRLHSSEAGDRLQIIVHHAVTDGIGLMHFANDLYKAYCGAPESRQANVDLLSRRGSLHLSTPEPVSWGRATRFMLCESLRFATTRPALLGDRRGLPDSSTGTTQLASASLSEADARRLADTAVAMGVGSNTLCLAAVYKVLAGFNKLHRRGGFVRLTLPVSLRRRPDARLTACNKIGYAFVDRDLASCRDPRELIPGIQAEVDAILTWSMAASFLGALSVVDRVPWGMRLATWAFQGVSTAVFSNMGDLNRRFSRGAPVGGEQDAPLIRGAPPVRPGTAVAFGVGHTQGGLTATISHDPARLTEADAVCLVEDFRDQLRELLDLSQESG